MLERLKLKNLKINIIKYNFYKTEVEFLSFTIIKKYKNKYYESTKSIKLINF